MLFLYQILLFFFGPVYLLARAFRGRRLAALGQRFGCYPKALEERLRALRHPIWLHLVSVGEAMAAQSLVARMREKRPDLPWVITTVTSTGQEVAKKLIRPSQDELLYLPWDFSPIVRKVSRLIQPRLFISFETELWPVLFSHLKRRGTPVLVVNGRISPSAYGRYLWARPFMARTLACVDLFLTQSPQDARRFAALGAAKDRIVVTGNLKWDVAPPHPV
jgi:3-deoxy-D-manno-octulosonic-acid transferase